jgi:tetratricopeptide (TPR) repeat protein
VDTDKLEQLRVPDTLTAVLQARLDGLPAGEKKLLQRASVVGRVFWSAAVEALGSEGRVLATELEAIVRRGLADRHEPSTFAQTPEYRFKHALMRDAAYDTVLKRERVLYHGLVAAWLVQVTQGKGRSDEHAAVIAEHYEHAGDLNAASEWYLRAGARAHAQGAPTEAYRFFDHALQLLPELDRDRRWQALLGRDEALGTLGRSEARQRDDRALVAQALEMGDDRRIAEAYYRRAYYLGVTGQYAEMVDACNRALEAARRGGSLELQAEVLGLEVMPLCRMGDLQAAVLVADRALACLKDVADEEVQARTLTGVALFYTESGDLARAAQLWTQQVAINGRRGDREGEAVGLSNLGYTYILLGLYPMAVSALERARELATAIGHRIFSTYSGLNLGLTFMRLNDLKRAEEILQQSGTALAAMNDKFGVASSQTYLAMVRELAGDVEGALSGFSTAREALTQMGATGYATDALAGIARCLVAGGQVDRAEESARVVWGCLTQQGASALEFPVLAYESCAVAFSALGDREAACNAIEAGRRHLLSDADRISVPEWRRSFLESVPEHRRIMEQ